MKFAFSRQGRRTSVTKPLAVLAGVALALSACGNPQSAPPGQPGNDGGGGANAAGAEKVTIGVGGQTLLTYLPTTLAQELGYYEEEGLDVDLQDLQGGSKALTAMIGGSTDVTSGFYEHAIQMQAKNQPVKAFVNMNLSSGLVLVVSEKNRDTIKSVADLKGKNVGVTSPGSSTDMFVKYLLAENGMALDDAAVSAIGAGSSAVAAIEQNQVDAAVMLEPDITVLGKRLGTEPAIIEDVRTPEGLQEVFGTDAWPSSSLYATSGWIEENPEAAQKLATAIKKALKFIAENSGEEIAAEMPEAFAGGDPEQYAKVIEEMKLALSTDGVFTEEGVQAVLETQRVANPEVGEAEIKLEETYTNEFVE